MSLSWICIAEIVAETNADFGTAINDIVSAHPECSEMNSYKVCSMQALHDGFDIVGGSIDERGGWLLRPGYRDMMQQIKGGKVDRVYICRMRQISGKERHLYSFFKRLMQHGVQVTAMEYSLRDRVNMFRLARRIERYATRKGLQLPW